MADEKPLGRCQAKAKECQATASERERKGPAHHNNGQGNGQSYARGSRAGCGEPGSALLQTGETSVAASVAALIPRMASNVYAKEHPLPVSPVGREGAKDKVAAGGLN